MLCYPCVIQGYFYVIHVLRIFVSCLKSSLKQISRQIADLIDFYLRLPSPEVQAPRESFTRMFLTPGPLADSSDQSGLLSLKAHTQSQDPQQGVPESQYLFGPQLTQLS